MIKTKRLALSLMTAFLMMFAVMMVSAAGLQYDVLTGNNQNVNPGSQIPITFKLCNSGDDYDISNIALTFPNLFGMTGSSWTSVSTTGLTISEGDCSSVFTTTLTIPDNQAAGTYSGNLGGTCRYSTSPDTSRDINNFGFTITVNPQPSLTATEPTTITPSQSSTFTITNDGNVDLTPTIKVDSINYNGNTLNFEAEIEGGDNIPAGQSKEITITATIPGGEESLLAGKTTPVTISAAGVTDIVKTLKVEGSYCKAGDIGDLKIKDIKFDNQGPLGDDDEWYMFDEIKVEVEVENNADKDIDDVIIEWGLYNKDTGEFIFDDEEKDFDLDKSGDDDDSKELTFSFTLDPDDFDEDYGEGDFVFILKAYSDDEGEELQCVSQIEKDIEVKKEDDYVIVRGITLASDTIPCNQILEGEFEVWNIGGEDQEDELYVTVENDKLKINERFEIGDLKILDDEKVSFSIKIPSDAAEGNYVLKIVVHEEDGDIFENGEDDKEATFASPAFEIAGNCIGAPADVEILAELDAETPDAVAGKQVIVKATLRNKGEEETTYTVSVEGNSAWSNLVAVDPQIVTIPGGETKTVNIILSINSDAEGEKSFTIKATSDGKSTTRQVALSITKTSDQTTEVAQHIRDNWFIYLIIIVNIILIIAIIIVIRRMVAPVAM